jgi:very-short-patch-repair endonuclease
LGRASANLAKALRKRSTDAERLLWNQLRARQMGGLKFRRQEPIGGHIVDFVCYDRKLVIELDGAGHASQRGDDRARDSWLQGQGFRVIRVLDNEILVNTQGVLDVIEGACQEHLKSEGRQA